MRKMQNEKWYSVGWGYTCNPFHASDSEVARVGLHSCTTQGCQEIHGGSAEVYSYLKIIEQWADEGSY